MSSGVEADIALDSAVVLSLGMNRVLGRTAGLAGRGAEALAALAAGKAEARAAALAEAESYDQALRQVLERNARIAALAETREKLAADVALPEPLPPSEQPAEELTAWCAATDTELDAAERALSEHLAGQVAAEIFAVPAGEGLHADLGAPTPPRPMEGAEVHRTLERVLARLLPDATEADRRAVAEAARLLAGAVSPEEAEGVLTEVRLRVGAANRRTEEVRAEERRRAEERDAAEQAEAERRYVLGSITSAFEEMGYDVEGGFETLAPAGDGTVVLSRGSWPDHSVRMRVDDAAHVRAKMVRTRPARSEDDRRLDVEREREWCEAFEAARERLAAAGVRSEVTWRLAPGVQELPVSGAARQTGSRPAQRERRREREK
ncbi:response regulator receiver protein [Spirillospora sp. NPDC029432]|uniref:response regulator receiver protein n=1 Tax=Spirillospora sp. NPDC029432 TaxID=3154599 RepID=UPI0034545098